MASSQLLPLIFTFLLMLGCGLGIFSFFVHPKLTGKGMFRVFQAVVGVAIALCSLIIFLNFQQNPLLLNSSLVALVLIISNYGLLVEERKWVSWLLYAAQTSTLIFVGGTYFEWAPTAMLFFLSGSLYLGITTYAMLLGHWYLVVPKLSEKPLLIANQILWVMLGLKLALSLSYIGEAESYLSSFSTKGFGYSFNWMILSMRYLWGYIILLIMSIFSWKLVKMRSIQSATGVYYVMVFFVLIGELAGNFIFFNWGLPL